MSASDGSNNNKITFEEIAPDWSKRLNKLTTAKGISYEKDTMYSDISDYKKYILLEKHVDIAHRTFFMEPLTIV
jgi:hypothetical protein